MTVHETHQNRNFSESKFFLCGSKQLIHVFGRDVDSFTHELLDFINCTNVEMDLGIDEVDLKNTTGGNLRDKVFTGHNRHIDLEKQAKHHRSHKLLGKILGRITRIQIGREDELAIRLERGNAGSVQRRS